jgi:hypothetical protein
MSIATIASEDCTTGSLYPNCMTAAQAAARCQRMQAHPCCIIATSQHASAKRNHGGMAGWWPEVDPPRMHAPGLTHAARSERRDACGGAQMHGWHA